MILVTFAHLSFKSHYKSAVEGKIFHKCHGCAYNHLVYMVLRTLHLLGPGAEFTAKRI